MGAETLSCILFSLVADPSVVSSSHMPLLLAFNANDARTLRGTMAWRSCRWWVPIWMFRSPTTMCSSTKWWCENQSRNDEAASECRSSMDTCTTPRYRVTAFLPPAHFPLLIVMVLAPSWNSRLPVCDFRTVRNCSSWFLKWGEGFGNSEFVGANKTYSGGRLRSW